MSKTQSKFKLFHYWRFGAKYCLFFRIEPGNSLKYISLVTLTLQNAILGLSMRYARTRTGDMFLSSTGTLNKCQSIGFHCANYDLFTAVLMSEVVKLFTCLVIVYVQSGGVIQLVDTLNNTIIKQPLDTIKICVPSLVYIIQNNLLYVSASHLDAATYQVG